MRTARGEGATSTWGGYGPARVGGLVSFLVLMAVVLAGCAPHDATGSAGSTEVVGGVGAFGSDDGGASRLQVSIEPAAPTVCAGSCVSLSAQATGAAPPYAIAWSGLEGDGSTVRVCPAATTTYTVTMTAGATSRGEIVSQGPTGSASVTVTVTPACAGDGGSSSDAAAPSVAPGKGHEICSQSWSGLGSNPSSWAPPNARMVALDGAGNMYVAATFVGTVNVAGQSFQASSYQDLLVVKVDPACHVLWAKTFGAPRTSMLLSGVAADAAGNVVVALSALGGTIDFGSGPVTASSVVFKLGPDGAGLWSRGYQGAALSGAEIEITDVAIDPRGNTVFAMYMTDGTRTLTPSADFGGGAVSFPCTLVELDANGKFVFGVDASAAGAYPYGLTTDSAGRILVTGDVVNGGRTIVAFDAGGHQLWVRNTAPGYINPWRPMVRVDANDEAFTVAGLGQTSVDAGWLNDTQVYKFSASGSPLWTSAAIPESTYNDDWWLSSPGRLAVDPSGRALVAATFAGSADFGAVGTLTSAGNLDSAVLRYDAQGRLIGGVRWGGAQDDSLVDVTADAAGDAVIAGWSVLPNSASGGQDSWPYAIFVAKLGW
jgi:hypothetical protein